MAILPMVLAAAYFAINWGLEIIHNIENQANLVVNSMAERHVWSLEKAQVYISEMNAKMDRDDPIQPEDCQNLLNEYASIGGFVSIGVFKENGEVICSVPSIINEDDRYDLVDVKAAVIGDQPYVGNVQIDPISGKNIIPLIIALNTDSPADFLIAGISLEAFQQGVSRAGIPADLELVFTDLNGAIIAIWPEQNNLLASQDPTFSFWARQIEISPQGKITTGGIDDVQRFFAYRMLSFGNNDYGIIRSGLPLENVFLEIRRLIYTILVLLVAVFLFSMVLAYLISGRVLERRSVSLVAAAQKIARGELDVRTHTAPAHTPDGLLELERTFNQMAEALEQREKSHQQVEEALRASNEKIGAIIHASPLAVIVESMDRVVVEWSPSAALLFGWSFEEVIGKKLPIFPVETTGLVGKLRDSVLSGKKIQNLETICRTKEGRLIPVTISAALLRDSSGESAGVTFLVADISEQKKVLEAMSESQQALSVLLNNLPGMAYRYSFQTHQMTFASPGSLELTGYPCDEFTRENGISFRDLIHPDDKPAILQAIDKTAQSGKLYRMIYRIKTANQNTRWVLDQGIGLVNNGGGIGSIEGYITDITEVKKREREMEVIASISTVMRSARGKTEISHIILDQIARQLDAEGSAIAMREPNGSAMVEIALGELRSAQGARYTKGEGLIGRVIESGVPVMSNDYIQDLGLSIPGIENQTNAVICVPLLEREQAMGCLLIVRGTDFSQDELRLVTSISDMAATAIRRITLYEQTEKRLQQLIALRTIETAITSSLDFRFTLSILLDQVVSQLNVDAADVWLYDTKKQRLLFVAGWGFRSLAMRTVPAPLGWGLPGKVAEQRAPLFIPNLNEWDGASDHVVPLKEEGLNSYFGTPIIAKGQLHGILEVFQRHTLRLDADKREFLNSLISGAAIAIDNTRLLEDLQRTNKELAAAYDQTILGWSLALEMRDAETEGHTRRVAEATITLAREMGLSESELVYVWRGAVLHDIGKMAIPDTILLKKEELTTEDWKILRKHPLYAQSMLSGIEFLQPSLDIPTFHHEHWDGNGYPLGLKGEQIPLAARIFAVVDVWDALRFDRHYRARWDEKDVINYINELSGKQFDPQVVGVFLGMLEEGKL
jgi:PAS domain S-box-containing protein